MPSRQHSAEVRRDHIERMPAGVGSVYDLLWRETVFLSWTWELFVRLFTEKGAGKNGARLMNETSPLFFRHTSTLLGREVQLGLARVTDPARQRRFENVSIARLLEALDD